MADERCSFQVSDPINEQTAVPIFGAASLCRLWGGGACQHLLHQPLLGCSFWGHDSRGERGQRRQGDRVAGHLDGAAVAHDQERPELRGDDHGVSFVHGRVLELAGGGALGHGHHRPARQCHGEDPVLPGVVSLRDILRRTLQQADN
jgi:hypothetical protein